MLRELLELFKTDTPVTRMAQGFGAMLDAAREETLMAGRHFFEGPPSPEDHQELLERDRKVNKLERKIRKQVISHLSLDGGTNASYGLLIMSLVKDVERIGDYAKNLSEIYQEGGGPLPGIDDPNSAELREFRKTVEAISDEVGDVFSQSDPDRAHRLIEQGRQVMRRSDAVVRTVAQGSYPANVAVTLVLGARYYKRIAAHLVNVLSGVVMPLHKLDYYDEDVPEPDSDEESGAETPTTASGNGG